jgi:hypothetical protein
MRVCVLRVYIHIACIHMYALCVYAQRGLSHVDTQGGPQGVESLSALLSTELLT